MLPGERREKKTSDEIDIQQKATWNACKEKKNHTENLDADNYDRHNKQTSRRETREREKKKKKQAQEEKEWKQERKKAEEETEEEKEKKEQRGEKEERACIYHRRFFRKSQAELNTPQTHPYTSYIYLLSICL